MRTYLTNTFFDTLLEICGITGSVCKSRVGFSNETVYPIASAL